MPDTPSKHLILTLAFGMGNNWSNATLRRITGNASTDLNARVFTQPDIGNLIEYVASPVIMVAEPPGKPAPTLRICRAATQWAKQNGITDIHLVAAAPHLVRARHDLVLAIRDAGGGLQMHICSEKELGGYHSDWWFAEPNTQRYTNSPWRWYPRECILRILMRLGLYRFVAS